MRFRRELLPVPRVFWERELGELHRPLRDWAKPKAGCPFHKSEKKQSFGVRLTDGYWHCFACDVGGSIVDFVMRRYGLSFREAAQRLGAWDDALQIDAVVVRQERAQHEQEEQERQAEQERERQERFRARDWLHCIARIYREAIEGLTPDDEIGWAIAALAFDELRDAEDQYSKLAGLA